MVTKSHDITTTLQLGIRVHTWVGESDLQSDDLRGTWEDLELRSEIPLLHASTRSFFFRL